MSRSNIQPKQSIGDQLFACLEAEGLRTKAWIKKYKLTVKPKEVKNENSKNTNNQRHS